MNAAGIEKEKILREEGFNDQDIEQWRGETVRTLTDEGFSTQDIGEYFGQKNPDMGALKTQFEANLKAHADQKAQRQSAADPTKPQPEVADEFMEYLQAGFQMSVTGLEFRGRKPDLILPEDAPMAARIMSQIGTLAGDSPTMVLGSVVGAAGGTAVAGPAGTVVGGSAGAFALPTAIRETLMDHYEKGDFQSFGDFWERASGVFYETFKSGTVGAVTGGVGMAAKLAAPVAKGAAGVAAEIAAMTSVGAALEGEVPKATDFAEAAILVGGMHGATAGAAKLRKIYAKTGMKPAEVVELANNDPVVKQELVSSNIEVPSALGGGELPGATLPEGEIKVPAPSKEYLEKMDALDAEISHLQKLPGTPENQARYEELILQRDELMNLEIEKMGEAEATAKPAPTLQESRILESKDGWMGIANRIKKLPQVEMEIKGGEAVTVSAEMKVVDVEGPFTGTPRQQNTPAVVVRDAAGTELGYLAMGMERTESGEFVHAPTYVEVSPEARRMGVASAMYEYANAYLAKLNPSSNRTELGEQFGKSLDYKKLDERSQALLDRASGKLASEPAPVAEEAPKSPLEEATAKIRSQIGENEPKKGKFLPSGRELYRMLVDKLDPINEAIKILSKDPKALAADKNAYTLSRMVSDATAKVKHVFEKGTLDYKSLAKNGKGMKEIIEPIKDELDGFRDYLVSARALEIEASGRQSGFDVEAARIIVENGKAKFETAAKEFVEFQNANLKYARDAGILTEKAYRAMVEAGKNYIPFSRVMEEGAGGKGKKPGSLKSLKGSERKIQDPFESVLENTKLLMKMAERNRAVSALVDLAEKSEGQTVIEKVPAQMRPIEVHAEEVAKFFEEHGIEADPEAFSIFRSQTKSNLAPNEFEVYRNGKREVYRVAEGAPEGLAEAINSLNGDVPAAGVLLKIARGITTVKKLGISMTPDFVARNFFRDQLTAHAFSKGGINVLDVFGAMGDLVKKSDAYYNWLKSGGANGSFLELNKSYIETDVFKLDKETGFIESAQNVVSKPVHWLKLTGELVEQATRLAEFKKVSEGQASGSKVFEGGMASREVTVDFARMGAKMSALNSITAFMNVSIQGLDRTGRAIKENPSAIAKRGSLMMTASALLWYANKDEQWYKEMPRWQKDMFWLFKAGDTIYRVPKPQELGILFGSLPERLLENFLGNDPKAMADFEETMFNLVTPSFAPDALAPFGEQWANRSLFTDAPIVPERVEGLLPELRYTEYTSETAKALGKMIVALPGQRRNPFAAPAVIDNYIQAWSGTLGKYAVQLADKGLVQANLTPDPVKPASTLADTPFIKAFVVRYPSASAQSIQDFYDKYEENRMVRDSAKFLTKQSNAEDMSRGQAMFQTAMFEGTLVTPEGIKETLSRGNKAIRDIMKTPTYSPKEKRQLIDGIYFGMINAARRGNELFDAAEKQAKAKK